MMILEPQSSAILQQFPSISAALADMAVWNIPFPTSGVEKTPQTSVKQCVMWSVFLAVGLPRGTMKMSARKIEKLF